VTKKQDENPAVQPVDPGHWQSAGSRGLPVRDTADWQSALQRSADW